VSVSVRALKGKHLELSTLNSVHIYSMVGPGYVLTMRAKGQGHRVIKYAAGASIYMYVNIVSN